jgi:hypothetical protein
MLLTSPAHLIGFEEALNSLVDGETPGFLQPFARFLSVTLCNRVFSLQVIGAWWPESGP